MNMADQTPKQSDIIIYTTPEGDVKIDVFFQDETVWLTQVFFLCPAILLTDWRFSLPRFFSRRFS